MRKRVKGILGLNTVKAFIVVLLALAIIAVVTLIVLGQLASESLISQVGVTVSNSTYNITLTSMNETAQDILAYSAYNSPACTNHLVTNSSDGELLTSGNYTLTNNGCSIASSADAGVWNNTIVNVSYDFSYRRRDQIGNVVQNTSTGITSFFGNSITYFALLGVVVIILIISLVVVVVNKFGGSGSTGGMSRNQPTV
jgi:hypothetical protein